MHDSYFAGEQRTMKLLPVLITAIAILMPLVPSQAASAPGLTPKDVATADGSCRVGLQGDNIYCILTAIETRIQLNPDSWSNDDESRSWTTWLSAFDNDLYSRWIKGASVNGQETVGVTVAPDGTVNISNGTFLQPPSAADQAPADQQAQFEAAIRIALEGTLKAAAPMPQTKNKLKEIHTNLTFMRDPKVVPRYGKYEYGFVASRGADGNLVVYGRTDKTGRAPGIQILSDRDGGDIKVTDTEAFMQHCMEIEKNQ